MSRAYLYALIAGMVVGCLLPNAFYPRFNWHRLLLGGAIGGAVGAVTFWVTS